MGPQLSRRAGIAKGELTYFPTILANREPLQSCCSFTGNPKKNLATCLQPFPPIPLPPRRQARRHVRLRLQAARCGRQGLPQSSPWSGGSRVHDAWKGGNERCDHPSMWWFYLELVQASLQVFDTPHICLATIPQFCLAAIVMAVVGFLAWWFREGSS